VFLPYVYAPWLLPFFVPWALLPWSVAWFFWRGMNVLLLVWSVDWAYRRRPLATALVFLVLTAPLAATLDTGNVTLLLALAVWAAQFTRPWVGGGLFTIAAAMKWFPAVLFFFLPARTRLWALIGLGVAVGLTLATWPQTLVQLDLAFNFPRPPRLDYVLFAWATVPWFWTHPDPLWWLNRRGLRAIADRGRATRRRWSKAFGERPTDGLRSAGSDIARWSGDFLGLRRQSGAPSSGAPSSGAPSSGAED